jgi:hypothetical protein
MSEDGLLVCDENDPAGTARSLLFVLRNILRDRFFILRETRAFTWKRTFEVTVDLPRYSVGSDGQYTVHQLSVMMARPEYEEELRMIRDALSELGIEDLRAGFTESNRLSGYVRTRGGWVPMYHGGLRLRSILPVITQLALSPRGSVVLVDDLDLGIDEETLVKLLGLIARWSSERRIQVVATSRLRVGGVDVIELRP